MKRMILALLIGSLPLNGFFAKETQALVRSRPSCNQVYQFLLEHMRQCPEEANGNCVPFSANLTRERGLDANDQEIFYCKLEGTSYVDLGLTSRQTGELQGLGDGDPIELGEIRDLVDVEMRADKYSHFFYDVRANEDNSVDLFNFRALQLSYTTVRGAPLTKSIYFTQFRVDGVTRPSEPEPAGTNSDNVRCTPCDCSATGIDSPACQECIGQRLDCLEGRVAQNLDPPVGDAGGPASPGTNVGAVTIPDQSNPAQGGGMCQLNPAVTFDASALNLGWIVLSVIALTAVRNKKGV